MKQKYFYLILMCFGISLQAFCQHTAKGIKQGKSLQFQNLTYKVTWIIENGKYGLMDTKTKEFIIKPTYEFAEIYDNDYSLVISFLENLAV